MATTYLCVETGKMVKDSRWLRLKFRLWRWPAARWSWPHAVCRHYKAVA